MAIVILSLLPGCSVEKNTGASRFYNSLVSKYNIYFNGNEAYKAGVTKVKESIRDDYSAILPVFEYSAPESAQTCMAEMERAIQKASKVIALHSITAKPEAKKNGSGRIKDEELYTRKEFNEWVDDSYLLIAKAQFYKKDYNSARSAISFDLGITTDKDIIQESSVWMARILTEEGKYTEAERVLTSSIDAETASRAIRAMVATTQADIALRQKKYQEAVAPLKNAIDLSSDKQTRVRLTYLLAQVCKAAGNNALSTRYFKEVIRMNPSYEFEFNAGINLAGVTDLSSGDAADLEKSLKKMLRDSKNKEYLDQIYFALGELAQRKGDINGAIGFYTQAAQNSRNNNRQKARAYLALGEYFYSLPQYMKASFYYDSSIVLLDKRFPDYENISRRASDLNQYAFFHTMAVTEDSLRRVAQMSPAERDKLIAGIIQKLGEDEMKAKMETSNDRYNMGQFYENEQRSREAISTEGGWYFYNPSALSFGRTEFRRRWGDRKLEDNWRRSNRSRLAVTPGTTETGETKSAGDSASVAKEKTNEFYLKNLPLSDSLIAVSRQKSAEALLGEGKILASRLNDTSMAMISLEAAAGPGGSDNTRAEALYELYRMLRFTDPAKAERRRADLISGYPQTDYALILTDPDYIRRQNEASKETSAMYESAYLAYKEGRFADVGNICSNALDKFKNDELTPKFMLLEAFAAGALNGEMAYKTKLDTLLSRYPQTPEGSRASEIIAVLRREIPEIVIAENKKIIEDLYVADTLQPHYVMIIAANPAANLNMMTFDIINFNLDNYSRQNYRTEGTAEENKYLMITVGVFETPAKALSWISSLKPSKEIRGADEAKLSIFIISRDNLIKFRQDKSIERYRMFYESAYPLL